MPAVTASLCSTLMFVVFVSADQKTIITAESGQDVTLTCRAPNNIRGVKWSRADLFPEHILLYKNGHFVPDNQHPSFKNRVDLQDRQMKDRDVSLIIKDVTINDTGTYECHVYMEETLTWELISLIYLRVLPEQKTITSESGKDVTLPCRAPINKIIGVEWIRGDMESEYVLLYRNGHFVPDNQHPSFKNRVDLQDRQMKDGDVSLILKDVTIIDTEIYKCLVFSEEISSWKLISTIYLIVPPDIKVIPANSGQNVTLTCRAPNKNNNISHLNWSRADMESEDVFLHRDGHFDPENQHPSFKNRVDLHDRQMKDGDVSLILNNVTINDTGTYKCHVNKEGRLPLFNSIIFLHVDPDHKTITAKSGQNVTLICRAPNNKINIVKWSKDDLRNKYVLWYRDGQFVTANQHPSFENRVDLQDRQMKDGDVSLILRNVTINDAGTYECRVYMAEKDSLELSFINLRVPPDPKILKADSGQNVTLPCRAPNNNIRVVQWNKADQKSAYVLSYQNGQFFQIFQHPSFKNRVDLLDRQMKDGDVSLILKNVTNNDTGAFMCGVSPAEKHSLETISIIYLIVVDPPGQTGGYPAWMTVCLGILLLLVIFLVYTKIQKLRIKHRKQD